MENIPKLEWQKNLQKSRKGSGLPSQLRYNRVIRGVRISLILQNRWRKRDANYFVRWKIISKRKGLRPARTLLVSQISRLIFRFQTAAPGSSRAVSRRWITKLKGFLAIPTARPNSRSFPWETDDENGRMFVAYCPAFRHAYETSLVHH